jgi:23S rRNA pseudouridine1911/1915/1917 synthase
MNPAVSKSGTLNAMTDRRILAADRGDAGSRLDRMVCRHLAPAVTRTRVQAWIESGHIAVNGVPARRVARRVAAGDIVSVTAPEAFRNRWHHEGSAAGPMAPENLRLAVLYEDEELLAVDKPAGMVVHPTYRNMTGTTMNALLWRARGWPAPQRPSIVGRLDKLTSGIVLVAKSSAAHRALQRAMASEDAEKHYLALVYGRVKSRRGEIDWRLHRDPRDRRRVVASPSEGARSLTRYERIADVEAARAGLSLLRCALATGRMHQIRAHLAASGWPIVGDAVYGEPRWSSVVDSNVATALGTFPRQALHAWRLGLTHPVSRRRLQIEAPVPRDLSALLIATGFAPAADGR